MSAIPGTRFNLTGASGSQGLLSPMSGWRAYVFPRGAWADQDSSGTVITFGTTGIASRFAVNNWIQCGTATANLRKVSAVGGNSIAVSGAAVTVTEDMRIFIIGNTQPSTSGGSATYAIPQTTIYHRDDTASDIYTNSMVTSDSDGLVAFYAGHGIYDVLIQDGNRSPQGYIADLPVGVVEGVSTTLAAVFGADVSVHADFDVTGNCAVGGQFSVQGNATVTGLLDATGRAKFGSTVTVNTNIGVTGTAVFGGTATFNGAIGVTGTATFGTTITTHGITNTGFINTTTDIGARRLLTGGRATAHIASDWSLSPGWGQTATVSQITGNDLRGHIQITAGSTAFSASPFATLTFKDGAFASIAPAYVVCRGQVGDQLTVAVFSQSASLTQWAFTFNGTPAAGETYQFKWVGIG